MIARDLPLGAVVRAPWRIFGDDPDLTGSVVKRAKGKRGPLVVWHDNGTVTPASDESELLPESDVDVVSLPA